MYKARFHHPLVPSMGADWRVQPHISTTTARLLTLPVLPCICAAFTIKPPWLLPGPLMIHFHRTLSTPR